jgi:hypothetical protein
VAGKEASLPGFGKLKVKNTPGRKARNPSTGATIKVVAAKKLAFTPAKTVLHIPHLLHVFHFSIISRKTALMSRLLAFWEEAPMPETVTVWEKDPALVARVTVVPKRRLASGP